MKRRTTASRWILTASWVVGFGAACTTNPLDPDGTNPTDPNLETITAEDQRKIDADNAAQNSRIDDAEDAIASLQDTVANLYPVAGVDVKVSAETVTSLFGEANPARGEDTGRKNPGAGYVSIEQALKLMKAQIGTGSSGGGSSGGNNGNNGNASTVVYSPAGANSGTQTFESSTTVEQAINALRWASQIKITTTNTSWATNSSVNNVQAALENLDDSVNFAVLGSGTNPNQQADDEFPTIGQATNVKQAINALRFYTPTQVFGFVGTNALANSYVNEAIQTLDKRAKLLEDFQQSVASGNSTITNATGVLYAPNPAPTGNYARDVRRTNGDYNLPVDGSNLQQVVHELHRVIENYRYSDNVKLDFSTGAPLKNTRWATGSSIRNGRFVLAGSQEQFYLEELLVKINEELTDLDGRISTGGSSGGGSGGPVDAFNVTYSTANADTPSSFGSATTAGAALNALRHAQNIKFNVTNLTGAGFPSDATFVQSAIEAAYTINRNAINALPGTLPANTSFVLALANAITNDTGAAGEPADVLKAFITSVAGGGSSGGASVDNQVQLSTATKAFYPMKNTVADALATIAQRLDALDALVDEHDDYINQIYNVNTVNSPFRANLRQWLLSDTMFINGLPSGGGGTAKILGPSNGKTNGSIGLKDNANEANVTGSVTGLAGAAVLCRETFTSAPKAHMCTATEVAQAMGQDGLTDTLGTSMATITEGFWVHAPTLANPTGRANAGRAGETLQANCQDWLYHSGDIADGTFAVYKGNAYQPRSGMAVGRAFQISQGTNCGQVKAVLCCQ